MRIDLFERGHFCNERSLPARGKAQAKGLAVRFRIENAAAICEATGSLTGRHVPAISAFGRIAICAERTVAPAHITSAKTKKRLFTLSRDIHTPPAASAPDDMDEINSQLHPNRFWPMGTLNFEHTNLHGKHGTSKRLPEYDEMPHNHRPTAMNPTPQLYDIKRTKKAAGLANQNVCLVQIPSPGVRDNASNKEGVHQLKWSDNENGN